MKLKMNQVVNELKALHLETLDENWIQNAYYSEFLEFAAFSQEYENILESLDIRTVFRRIIKSIDNWLNPLTNSVEEKSWSSLSPYVNHQALLALVAYYIDYGSKHVLTDEYRNNALLASRLYYKLLSIAGYKAYNIYHSQLFALSLACLGFPKVMCENEDKYFNSKELTREVNSVIKHLRLFVLDLRTIIKNLLLTPSDINFEDILSNLVDITGGAIVNKFNIDQIEFVHISTVIYDMINILICESTGEPNTVAIGLLFKSILPKLIAASVDCRNNNKLVRASYVTYSGLLLSRYGKAALIGYTVLLQHLCYNLEGLERAEVRTARVSLVVGLMSLLPRKSYRNTVKWLLQLSTTAKVPHRHIAMEILCKLLENDPEQVKPNDDALNILQPVAQGNGQQDPNQQPNDTPVVENGDDTITANDANQSETETSKSALTTDDESSQDLHTENNVEDLTEEDIAGLLRQRAQTAPHVAIVRALYERTTDTASSLRARALTAFSDCLAARRAPTMQAIKELNGEGEVSRLLVVAVRCVGDERAVVRRAAVVLLHRLLSEPDTPAPSPNDLGILVGVCRDASILVRSMAVTVIGQLITQRPSPQVFDAFLTGPMHQLSDPETKMQEQVVTLIKELLIERLQKYNENVCEDPLPWMFLAGVVRHNMRRHLQKACALLAKFNNCINHRVIDILSTHLGVKDDERDLQCLVLLTSAARHVEYSDVAFVFDYYYELTEHSQCRDGRLLPFTLELMTEWSRWASASARMALRDHLIRYIVTAADDARRIGARLAANLDPDNLQWATELMQISERRALSGGCLEEWMRAADLSLVAPSPPAPELVALFLNALAQPPPEWSDAERGMMVAGAGRLCVRSREAAAATAPLLAALLSTADAPLCARINALYALTDICIRYTCIVEPLLETMCACVSRDAEPPLRRVAVRALTRLLLGEYLRLRTPLYYRYCALLADKDHDVREPAEYYVTCCLAPSVIYHHFVDCVLHYNSEETESISFDARQLIYDVMLQRLSIVQRMNVQCRLAQEVLVHAADVSDENEDLPPTLNAALLDTITLLCGPRMKLPKKPQNPGQHDDIIADLQERVTTNIVSHKMKRMVAEVVMPAILRLYARLRARGGQLAAYLVRIATDMLSDYRLEIEELITNDEELVVRIQQFQETIGLEPSFGNSRNLVTSSVPPEPETPQAPPSRRRRGEPAVYNSAATRRSLRM